MVGWIPYTKLFDFTQSLGKNPRCALTIHPNGKLYGTTYEGGSNNLGVLFEFDLNTNSYIKKLDFSNAIGFNPKIELLFDFAGNLYGLVSWIGDYGISEHIFKYNMNSNNYSRIFKFGETGGHYFSGGLALASNGKYYSATGSGGKHSRGSIIEFDYNNKAVSTKFNFDDSSGFSSNGAVLHASNDKIYGITRYGGLYGYGGIFEYDYNNGVYTKIHDFSATDGIQSMPGGMIMEASNGKIYGMRNGGGFYGLGTFYEFDIATDSFVVKLHFNDTLGAEPLGGLVQASNGKLYAGISGGGPSAQGIIIEYDINTDSVIIKKDFNGTGVYAYNGTFIEVTPNKFYALSIVGGQNNEGALYEYDCITNQITILYSFSAPTGCDPVGSLVYASNGKLYGSTKTRNIYDIGGLFEFDHTTGLYTHKLDWEPIATGWRPGLKIQEVGCIAPGILASGPVSFCQGDSVILSAFGSSSNSFQWHRNGNPIAGANSQNITVKLPGKYSVSVTDTTCSLLFTSNPVRVRIPCLPPFDNQDKLASTLTDADIFLNYDSKQQQFEIMATDLTAETYNLLIADATGRILLNENSGISNNSIYRNIDCSTFAKGLYIVKIIAGNKILSRKFVKER